MHALGEGDQVVVALDRGRLAAGLARAALDDVRIDRALGQVLHAARSLRDGEELLPELRADDAPFLFRLHHAVEQLGIALFGMHVHEIHVELLGEDALHLFGLVLAQ